MCVTLCADLVCKDPEKVNKNLNKAMRNCSRNIRRRWKNNPVALPVHPLTSLRTQERGSGYAFLPKRRAGRVPCFDCLISASAAGLLVLDEAVTPKNT